MCVKVVNGYLYGRWVVFSLDGLVVQLALQLLVVRHLAHRLHEVLLDDVLPLGTGLEQDSR